MELEKEMKTKKPIKRVYVAGPFNAGNVMDVLNNMREGISICAGLMEMGMSPFCPWADHLFQLQENGKYLKIEDYYRYSIDWLEVSDAMLVLPGYKTSKGTLAEIEFAKKHGIPIYYKSYELIEAFINNEKTQGGNRR